VNKRRAVAFTGPSNSGKTTLIVKIAESFINEHSLEVSIIKHDPKDKAQFDVARKDSYKFSATGAEVIVASPTRTTYFSQRRSTLDEMVTMLGDFDILLVEGLRDLPLVRIGVFRGVFDETYLPYLDALAVDESVDIEKYNLPKTLEVLDLNNTQEIINWILQNGKEI